VSFASLALAVGVSKDAARVGLKELFQKFGHYAGKLSDSVRLKLQGVGTVSASHGVVKFFPVWCLSMRQQRLAAALCAGAWDTPDLCCVVVAGFRRRQVEAVA